MSTTAEKVKKTPHDLIQKDDVAAALRSDKGIDAKLTSFTIKDFTNKGDNYVCVVSSVNVKYTVEDLVQETSYVVKLNPCRSGHFNTMANVLFEKEIAFYQTLLPLINDELNRVDQANLKVPKYYHSIGQKDNEVIYLEDLRSSGYKMRDRKTGLDEDHAVFILRELARLHAASHLLMTRGEFQGEDIEKKFPFLEESMTRISEENSSMTIDDFFNNGIANAANIAGKSKGYEKVEQYLNDKKETGLDMFNEMLIVTEQFKTICHGDCWNNNFLFKYSGNGKVEDCRLLDFQITRVGSPALDLNYMLFCSLTSEVRNSGMEKFMTNYYATIADVMAGGSVAMKFTQKQLKDEFTRKNGFGLLMGVLIIPLILMDSEDAIEFDTKPGEDLEKFQKDYNEKITDQIQNNVLLKPRFLGLFDDLVKSGLIQ